VFLAEDEALLQNLVAGICRLDWEAMGGAALNGHVHVDQLACDTVAMVSRLSGAPSNDGISHNLGLEQVKQEETPEEQGDGAETCLPAPIRDLMNQRCLLRFGSNKSGDGIDWNLCFRHIYTTTAYQQAVFSLHKDDIRADRLRCLQLPEDLAYPPELDLGGLNSPTAPRTRSPSGQAGNTRVNDKLLHLPEFMTHQVVTCMVKPCRADACNLHRIGL
jgi:hypothetical protein